MSKNVSKVSAEAISAERNSYVAEGSSQNREPSFSELLNTSFVSKLSDEEIRNFFKKYEMVYFDRIKDETGNVSALDVTCSDFSLLFGDNDALEIYLYQDNPYDTKGIAIREFHHQEYVERFNSQPKFNFDEFKAYCESIGSNALDVINQDIQENLLGNKRNYLNQRADLQEKILHDNFDNIPEKYKKIIKPTTDIAELVIRSNELKEILKKYGSLENIEALLAQKGN